MTSLGDSQNERKAPWFEFESPEMRVVLAGSRLLAGVSHFWRPNHADTQDPDLGVPLGSAEFIDEFVKNELQCD